MPPAPQLQRFVRSVHRRMLMLRTVERVAITLCIAAGVGIFSAAILWWRARPAMGAVQLCLVVGVVAGLAWAMFRPPRPIQAALEADRQLGWSELLSSAWLLVDRGSERVDPWSASVIVEADRRAAGASTSSLKLSRLGSRTWAGTALAVALAWTVAAFSPASPLTSSNALDRVKLARGGGSQDVSRALLEGTAASNADRRPVLLADPDDANASTMGQNSAPAPGAIKPEPGDANASENHANGDSSEEGHGGGSARTQSPAKAVNPALDGASADHPPAPAHASPEGVAAGGNGASTNDATQTTAAHAGGTAAFATQPNVAPPWTTPDWSAAVDRAQHAMSTGHVPATYRDLVRGYFTPE